VIAGVAVTTSSISTVSDTGAPITLPVSAMHTASGTAVLDPASATEIAYVDAKQIVGSTVVTIKSAAADDTSNPSGAYSLTLAAEAPLLGQYVTSLPITLTAQSGNAGLYAIEASANGYLTSAATAVDLTSADSVQDFVLQP
jgi:hypothetical protein